MRWIGLLFAALAGVLLFWQLKGAKGSGMHVLRGLAIGPSGATSIILNIVWANAAGKLVWDVPFLVHVVIGSSFLFYWFVACLFGVVLLGRGGSILSHRRMTYIQIALYMSTVLSGFAIPVWRRYFLA